MPFVVRRLTTGELIGSTSYLDPVPRHRRVEIGATWYRPDVWATAVNPECKLLLLAHAFDTLGMNRVSFVTDLRNTRSQAAIAKLGAVREGVCRAHMVTRDGRVGQRAVQHHRDGVAVGAGPTHRPVGSGLGNDVTGCNPIRSISSSAPTALPPRSGPASPGSSSRRGLVGLSVADRRTAPAGPPSAARSETSAGRRNSPSPRSCPAATVASGGSGLFPCCRGPTPGVAENTGTASLNPSLRVTFNVTSAFLPRPHLDRPVGLDPSARG